MNEISKEQIFLRAGAVSWIIYLLTFFVIAAMTPGYSHIADIISELGRNEVPYHEILNAVTILYGFLILLSGLGLFYSVKRFTGKNSLAIIIGILVAVFGTSIIFAGLFPMPDPLHNGYGMGTVQFVIPIFLAVAFWKTDGSRTFAISHIVFFIIFILVIIYNVVTVEINRGHIPPNIGLIQRISVLSIFIWYMFTYYWLLKRKQ